jgi:hypothetical protein
MRTPFLALCFCLAGLYGSQAAEDWGRTGHRATAAIAEQYLSDKARAAVSSLLNGESMALVSTYADEIKSDSRFRKYSPWHYVNYPFDQDFEDHPRSDRGDLIAGIERSVEVLKDRDASREDKVFHLKLLIHFIGDLHQPLHVGMADDRGGNQFQVRWFDRGVNLHSVWDTELLEEYGMSYTELAANHKDLTQWELRELQSGSPTDWMKDSRALCKDIYANTEVGDKLGYDYMYRYLHNARAQLLKGGVRLAAMLNEIFA